MNHIHKPFDYWLLIPLYATFNTSVTRGKHSCTKNTNATVPLNSAHLRPPANHVFSSCVGAKGTSANEVLLSGDSGCLATGTGRNLWKLGTLNYCGM